MHSNILSVGARLAFADERGSQDEAKIETKSAFIARAKGDWCGVGYYKS